MDVQALGAIGNGTLGNGLEGDCALLQVLEELSQLKATIEKEEDKKSRLLLEKLAADEEKKVANKQMAVISTQSDEKQKEFTKTMRRMKDDVAQLEKGNSDLRAELKRCQTEVDDNQAKSDKLLQQFKIYAQMPEKKVKFTSKVDEESRGDRAQSIRGVFSISHRPSVLLRGGQALITFEEEKVASQILRMARCSVACESQTINVKPKVISLEPSVKYEIHMDVSKKALRFSGVPVPPTMEEERTRDRLEMSFSRPSRGGGEVEKVDYDRNTGTGQVTFLGTGVAESLALKRKYGLDVEPEVKLNVSPVYSYQLKKFQSFCGVPKRTILLEDIKDVEDEEDLQDHLEIHFQKPSNFGGEVESIKYISSGKIKAFFSEDMAEKQA